MKNDKTLFHKKTEHFEVTVSKTTVKEKVLAIVTFGLIAIVIWYFFIR